MTRENEVFIGIRVQDLPEPYFPSIKRPCSGCGLDTWVSESLKSYWSRMKVFCDVCANKVVAEDPEPKIKIPQEAILELLREYDQLLKVRGR